MLKQMGAVLRTYVQRCRSLLVGGLVVGGLLQVVVTLCTAPLRDAIGHSLPFISMGMLFLGMQLWSHLREQILGTRRFLWPGYVVFHLAVFAIFAGLLALAWPLVFTYLSSGGLGLTAISIAFFALMGWCIVTMSALLMVVTMAAYLAACFGIVSASFPAYLDAHQPLAIALLVGGVVFTAGAVWRLTRIDESDPAYNKKVSFQRSSVLPKMTGQMAQPQAWWSGRRLRFAPRLESYLPRSGNQWERSRRLRMMRPSLLAMSVLMTAVVALPQLLISHFIIHTPDVSRSFIFPLFIILFMSGNTIASSWMQSWRYMDLEFVRPIGRRTLLKDIAVAMAVQSLQSWAVLMIVIVTMLGLTDDLARQAPAIAAMIVVSFAGLLLNLPVSFLVMRFRSPGGVALAGIPVAVVSALLVSSCYSFPIDAPWIASAGVIGMVLLAIVLLKTSATAWDHTDLA